VKAANTTDLVTRLRQGCGGEPCRMMEARSGCTCAEAADEIERLHAELDAAHCDIMILIEKVASSE
jgi:hypothetical protein